MRGLANRDQSVYDDIGIKTLVDMLWNGGIIGNFRFGNLY